MESRSLWLLLVFVSCLFLGADSPVQRKSDKAALATLQDYVGSWRGVGQVRRGSNQGAWIEKSNWQWSFEGDETALRFEAPKGKYLSQGKLLATDKAGQYQLVSKGSSGEVKVKYIGAVNEDGSLVLQVEKAVDGFPERISIRLVAEGKRLVVLYERRSSGDRYARMAEVGYTREGSGFGKGTSFVECVVTGGKGTIPVTFEGKTYYVCCGGCKDLFNEDPAAVLAEYRDKKKAEAESKGS